MFLQGFVFALGFGAGCLVFAFAVVTALLMVEKIILLFRPPKEVDGTIDIRRWQEQTTARKSARDHPCNAG
ncbi:MAG: hypothetical protein WDN23_13260 [Edaphobacter sp.]